jgi:hypothetical protein
MLAAGRNAGGDFSFRVSSRGVAAETTQSSPEHSRSESWTSGPALVTAPHSLLTGKSSGKTGFLVPDQWMICAQKHRVS